jgi:hypothetical protein
MCECRLCVNDRNRNAIVERGNVEEMRSLIYDLRLELDCAELDLNVNACILDGSWPQAREYGERIIAACDKREKELKENLG